MKYRNKLALKLITRKIMTGWIMRGWKFESKIYDYIDKWFVGLIIKLKHNPILIFLWSFWNKIVLKECIKFDNKYGKDLEKLIEGFANNFKRNATIKRSD